MTDLVKRLRELKGKRNKIDTELRTVYDGAEKEDRGFNADEKQTWDNLHQARSDLDQRIEATESMMDEARAYAQDVDDYARDEYGEAGDRNPSGRIGPSQERSANGQPPADPEARVRDAFNVFLRGGITACNEEQRNIMMQRAGAVPDEVRAQGTTPDTAGGYAVTEESAGRIVLGMQDYDAIGALAGQPNGPMLYPTATGALLPVPKDDDFQVGEQLAENAQASQSDQTLGIINYLSYIFTSKIIRVSFNLLQDANINIMQYLEGKGAERLGRILSSRHAIGGGPSAPTPTIEGLTIGAAAGVDAVSATAFTYEELLDLKHEVDPAYRRMGPRWVFNDNTLKVLKLFTETDSGRPLWQPNIALGEPPTIDGDQYVVDQDMPDIATGTVPVVYGALSRYGVRAVRGIEMLRFAEKYADSLQVGFLFWTRRDARVEDSRAIKRLTMA
ncbi:MAG: phage major capsid protein [Pseudomonadota bacterium]